jgi:hypothetical protein
MTIAIDEQDPRLIEFNATMTARLRTFRGRDLTGRVLREIDDTVRHLTQRAKLKGLKLPPLTAVVLRQTGVVEVLRADMEDAAIEQTILYLAQKYRPQSVSEIAEAICRSFPEYAKKQFDRSTRDRLMVSNA